MGERLRRISEWAEERERMSNYLSKKENWTPMLKMVSRDFLLVGVFIGAALGCYVGYFIWGFAQ